MAAINFDLELKTPPTFWPLTLDEIKEQLKLPLGQTSDDNHLVALLKAATKSVEGKINKGLCEQVWVQTQDLSPKQFRLYKAPVLSVVEIDTISSWDDDTQTPVDSGDYILHKNKLTARSSWPSHREMKSFITEFVVGWAETPAVVNPENLAAARENIPEDIRTAVAQMIGHLLENPEGQGADLKYEIIAKRYGGLPPNVSILLAPYVDWTFV
jgi:uncharacterized phiE125 gp8 family phage protein